MAVETIIQELIYAGRIILDLGEGRVAMPLPQGQKLEDALGTTVKVKTRDPKDCKRILKLCDAEECVDMVCNDPTIALSLVNQFLKNLGSQLLGNVGGTATQTPLTLTLAKKVAECMKKKVLGQSKPRTRSIKPRYTRKP
ncbi:MAG: hypothetical protein M3P26_17770 [Gemmatimonadota bacterium]|nr:hypothetical protein [Gemmatimonadota bacterium]